MVGRVAPLVVLSLAAGVLTKLAPLMALPFLVRYWSWRARLTAFVSIAGGLGAYVLLTRHPASGLTAFGGSWRNNELAFHYLGGRYRRRQARRCLQGGREGQA